MNAEETRLPEVSVPTKTEVIRLPDGRTVRRTTYQTGNVVDTLVWFGDFPNAKPVRG